MAKKPAKKGKGCGDVTVNGKVLEFGLPLVIKIKNGQTIRVGDAPGRKRR